MADEIVLNGEEAARVKEWLGPEWKDYTLDYVSIKQIAHWTGKEPEEIAKAAGRG
jgi:hypothetical protein